MKEKRMFNSWYEHIKEEFEKEYFKNLIKFLNKENKVKTIFPKKEDLFKCFELTEFNNLKVVILGQDPYHNENEAMGLCFSVNENMKTPPSLKNIFKELDNDLSIKRSDTNLSDWAKQGILLLNTVLTVEKNKPLSHRNKGWEVFTDFIIKLISDKHTNIVFVLWGNSAISKESLIDNKKHYIVKSAHPSPFSYERGFKGSKPFSKINNYLNKNNKKEIIW